MPNLYICDSSDEDIDVVNINIPSSSSFSFKISGFLNIIGQKILLSARGGYQKKKLDLLEKMSNKPSFILKSEILNNYLFYKKNINKNSNLFKDSISSSVELLKNIDIDITNDILSEKFCFTSNLNYIIQELTSLILLSKPSAILTIALKLDDERPAILLTKIINSLDYFSSISDENKIITANSLINNPEKQITDLGISSFIEKSRFSTITFMTSENFITSLSEQYIQRIYKEQSITLTYNSFTELKIPLLDNVTIPKILSFYNKFVNTSIAEMREIFIKNTDDSKKDLYISRYLLEWINLQNAEINLELIKHRPKEIFSGSFQDTLVNFLLEHRILRSKIKEQGIKQKGRILTHNKDLPIDQTDERVEIYGTGSRSDSRFLPDSNTYQSIAENLQSFNIPSNKLVEYLIQIINGDRAFKENPEINPDAKIYLYKFADLLFNLESERNISSFITNLLFFDLVVREEYNIIDLPNKLPMAMGGAVEASRFIQQKNNQIIGFHKFDYKGIDCDILDALELEVKNCQLLFDWLQREVDIKDDNKHLDNLQNIVDLISQIRDILKQPKSDSKKRQKTNEEKKQPSAEELFEEKLSGFKNGNEIAKIIGGYIETEKSKNQKVKEFKSNVLAKITTLIQDEYKKASDIIFRMLEEQKSSLLKLLEDWYHIEIAEEYLLNIETDQTSIELRPLMNVDDEVDVIPQLVQMDLGGNIESKGDY